MKKVIVLFIILLSLASAEILLKETSLDKIDKKYIRLDTTGSLGRIVFAFIDYGQDTPNRDHVVINKDGSKREFHSEIEILNIFYDYGWEIKEAVSEPRGGADNSAISGDTYYILERLDKK